MHQNLLLKFHNNKIQISQRLKFAIIVTYWMTVKQNWRNKFKRKFRQRLKNGKNLNKISTVESGHYQNMTVFSRDSMESLNKMVIQMPKLS